MVVLILQKLKKVEHVSFPVLELKILPDNLNVILRLLLIRLFRTLFKKKKSYNFLHVTGFSDTTLVVSLCIIFDEE